MLQVKDTGCGISSQDLPHVFTKFARSQHGANKGYSGSGLGLAISKRYGQKYVPAIFCSHFILFYFFEEKFNACYVSLYILKNYVTLYILKKSPCTNFQSTSLKNLVIINNLRA